MKFLRFLFGVLCGFAVGWVAGSLLAPRSGREVQEELRHRIELVIEEGRRAAEARKAELEAELQAAKRGEALS
jgi:gas vesicle protein